jgi:hypothetical protein
LKHDFILRAALVLLLFGILRPPGSAAQSARPQVWTTYTGTYDIAGPWFAFTDLQYRHEFGDYWREVVLRPAAGYRINGKLSAMLGYTYQHTDDAGSFLDGNRIREHVPFGEFKAGFGPASIFSLRFRYEQRWLTVFREAGAAIEPPANQRPSFGRLRLRLGVHVPIDTARGLSAFADEEYLHNVFTAGGTAFDHNRLRAGLNWRFRPGLTAEFILMWHSSGLETAVQQRPALVLGISYRLRR